jgi:hypothetical protein
MSPLVCRQGEQHPYLYLAHNCISNLKYLFLNSTPLGSKLRAWIQTSTVPIMAAWMQNHNNPGDCGIHHEMTYSGMTLQFSASDTEFSVL